MIFFIVILIAIIISGMTAAKKGEFFEDYCSPRNTGTINGIFSILIILSHAVTYVKLDGVWDEPYFSMRTFLGQLIVVTYLFYSGFGIMESYKKKGIPYIKALPVQRLFRTWYHFAIVIVMYAIVSIGIRGLEYTPLQIALSFTGFETLGNSNWYMFVTFVLYIIIVAVFLLLRKSKVLAVAGVCVVTALFAYWEIKIGLASQWYNTVMCFPAGMVFSLVKPYLDKVLMKNDLVWYGGFTAIFVLFGFFSQNRGESVVHHSLFAIFFALTVTVMMMKVQIRSTILDWFSQHIFSFFILQRIPMLLLRHYGFAKEPYFYIIMSFFLTVVMSMFFDAAMDKLDSVILKPRKKKEIKE